MDETVPESVFTRPERVEIFPVADKRFEFVIARFPERVAILPVAVAIFVSWRVFVPWSFWSAERTVSVAVTIPADGVNPVRRDESTRAAVK